MDVGWYYRLIFLFIILTFSALFSGSEVALFSLNKKKLEDKKNNLGLVDNYILNLINHPKLLLVTILIGNTVLNVGASIVSVSLAVDVAHAFNYPVNLTLIIQIVVLTILILLFAEITPKVWASKNPKRFSNIVAVPLYFTYLLLLPVSKILSEFLNLFASSIHYDKKKTALSSEQIAELADLSVEKGTLEEEEQELIQGLVSFKTVTAREVMTPRVDIISVPIEATFDEVMKIITESGHSRLPLYEGSLDQILGILYAKDLLPYISKSIQTKDFSLKRIARDCMFIPENKLISDLMHEFQSKNTHIGIVIDEYGGTSGLISLEDILEEIVGEIRDEYDKEEDEITKLGDNKYLILGKVPIDEINELLGKDFTSENDDYDSLGGFIFNQAGKVPEEGYTLEFNGYRFTVKNVKNNRINSVLVEKLNPETSE